jgi:predicted unusual protein kinase regulating ubiquinone biosynthesis (AarF/ABC1/UbiB family)
MAARRILERVSKAFGVMMLDKGLFQADAHPGNILVMKGACAPLPAVFLHPGARRGRCCCPVCRAAPGPQLPSIAKAEEWMLLCGW